MPYTDRVNPQISLPAQSLARRLALALSLLLLFPASLTADQSDSRLDDLFNQLLTAEDSRSISRLENQIWEIWHSHADADVEALMTAGIQRMNSQRLSEALVIFSQIIERYPDYAEAWNKRATLYYIAGEYEASIEDIEEVLALEPRHFGALSGLGLVYMQRQDLARAKMAFEQLVRVHPNSPNARQNLEFVTEHIQRSVI